MPKTFDDYASDLKGLIDEAREAILGGDQSAMKDAHGALGDFIANSDDTIHGVIELDNVASNTMQDVTLARLDQSLVKNLSARSADVERLIKTISGQSAVNNSAAASIRLERVKALLDAGTTAVNELKKFADTVDTSSASGDKLAKLLTDAIAAVTAVQKQIAT
jgi:hypothetical protein